MHLKKESPISIWSLEAKGAYKDSHQKFEPTSNESPFESNEHKFELSAEVWLFKPPRWDELVPVESVRTRCSNLFASLVYPLGIHTQRGGHSTLSHLVACGKTTAKGKSSG